MGELFDLINFNISDFIFQAINIVVLIYFLNKFLFKKVITVINERNKEVNNLYKDIDEALVELELKNKKYDSLLENVNVESDSIIKNAKVESKKIKEQSLKQAKENAEKELKKARLSIEKEKKEALEEIKKDISELVVESTKALLQDEYSKQKGLSLEKKTLNNLGKINE